MGRSLRLALGFLTILPVGEIRGGVTESQVAASRFAFPVVGLALGLALAGLSGLLAKFGMSPGPSSWMIVAAAAILTGGLHLDGVADTFDGLFLTGGSGRRLAAMKDSHIGSFGVAGLVMVLLGKFAAIGALSGRQQGLALIGAFAASRTLVLVAAGSADYARPDGTGRALIDATTPNEAHAAGAGVLLMGFLVGGVRGLIASLLALAIARFWARMASRNLGGITGDILGAIVETSELAFLLAFGMFPR